MPFPLSSRYKTGFLRLLVFVLFWFCGMVSAAETSYTEYPPDIRRILERGELVVALPQEDLLPFFYVKNGELRGSDIDLARGFAKQLQVKLRFNRTSKTFNGVLDVIARGDADLAICMLSRTFVRARKVRFSEPYLVLHHALAVNQAQLALMAKTDDLRTVIQHFKGSIGVQAGGTYVDFAQNNFPNAKVIGYTSWNDAIAAVKRGDLDAVYSDDFQIKLLMQSDAKNSLILRAFVFTDTQDPLAIAVRHDSHQLLSLANLYLSQQAPITAKALLKRARNP